MRPYDADDFGFGMVMRRPLLLALIAIALAALAILLLRPRGRHGSETGRPGADSVAPSKTQGARAHLDEKKAAGPRRAPEASGNDEAPASAPGAADSGAPATATLVRLVSEPHAKLLPRPLGASALWPAERLLRPLAPSESGGVVAPPGSLADQLRSLVERYLAPALRPADWSQGLFADGTGKIFARLGSPAGPCEGLASPHLVLAPPCLVFELRSREPVAAAGAATLAARLPQALAPLVLDELARPACAPRPHPTVAGPDAFAVTALLDRSGVGAIYPYLYLYQTKETLVGVFQQVPHGTR